MEFRGTCTKNARLNKPVISRSWLTGVAIWEQDGGYSCGGWQVAEIRLPSNYFPRQKLRPRILRGRIARFSS